MPDGTSLRLLLKDPGEEWRHVELGGPSHRAIQAAVGGTFTLLNGILLWPTAPFVLYAHDEGAIRGLAENVRVAAPYAIHCDGEGMATVLGPLVATRVDEEGRSVSVQDGDLDALLALPIWAKPPAEVVAEAARKLAPFRVAR